ncbi:MAG: hypothetical protein SWK76_17325 [Actinomycetota bacterium]|nr:hypothetical protein [Actinomycetota bacterium]
MAVYKISSSELRFKAADLTKALRAGDSFVLMHYNEPVGYISSEVPKKFVEEGEFKKREEFKKVK